MTPPIDPAKRALTRVTCAPHVPPILQGELEALGFEIQNEDHVALDIGASLVECLDLCLRLRTAHHVLWLLSRFRCPSPKALYTQVAAYPWELLIPNDSFVCVTSNVTNPKIDNSMYPNLVVKDAIVDRISKRTGARPDSGSDRSRIVIHLGWKGDRAWLYLNVNGVRLSDRGYRKLPHEAPMRETLAAAVLLSTGYDGSRPLVNPMCGSGTLAIEGALIGAHRAPGLLRSNYSFGHTLLDLDERWSAARASARKLTRQHVAPIIASDRDPRAIEAAKRNAKTAGVDHLIEFHVCDVADTPLPGGAGDIVMNPEYGLRLGDERDLEQTYSRIGDFLKQRAAGWTGHVFTGNRELSKRIGLRTTRRTPFMNAQIECRLLTYEMYAGSRQSRA
jgi:putative N6-adenine-specific DNA methylase